MQVWAIKTTLGPGHSLPSETAHVLSGEWVSSCKSAFTLLCLTFAFSPAQKPRTSLGGPSEELARDLECDHSFSCSLFLPQHYHQRIAKENGVTTKVWDGCSSCPVSPSRNSPVHAYAPGSHYLPHRRCWWSWVTAPCPLARLGEAVHSCCLLLFTHSFPRHNIK